METASGTIVTFDRVSDVYFLAAPGLCVSLLQMTKEFMLGTGLVLVAVYLYSSFPAVSPSVTITVSPPDHHSNKT